MKVFEIIFEQPSTKPRIAKVGNTYSVIFPNGSRKDGFTDIRQATDWVSKIPTLKTTPTNPQPGKDSYGRIEPSLDTTGKPVSPQGNLGPGGAPKSDQGFFKKWEASKARNEKLKERKRKEASVKFDTMFNSKTKLILRGLGLVEPVKSVYTDLEILDEDYKNGFYNDAELKTGREYIWGVFSAQILAPTVVKLASRAIGVTTIIRIFKNILALGGGPAGLAAAIATEGFFAWLRYWLGTEEGRQFLQNKFLLYIIKFPGKGLDQVWNELFNYYKNSKEAKAELEKNKPNQSTQPAAPEKPIGTQPTIPTDKAVDMFDKF